MNDSTGETSDVVSHVIQPGNTLTEIASLYDGVTADDLYSLNPNVDPYALTIGAELTVVSQEREQQDKYLHHTVQPRNTLNEVASVYDGVTVDDLLEANPDVDPYDLTIGSQLIIPIN